MERSGAYDSDEVVPLYRKLRNNDASITDVDTAQYYHEFRNIDALELGEALNCSANVQELKISNTSLFDLDDTLEPLFRFIATNTCLRFLRVSIMDDGPTVLEKMFYAISQSTSIIKLELPFVTIHPTNFFSILEANVIQDLYLGQCFNVSETPSAFAINASLIKLTIAVGQSDNQSLINICQSLHRHPKLQEFEIKCYYFPTQNFSSALGDLLTMSTTLQKLTLIGCEFQGSSNNNEGLDFGQITYGMMSSCSLKTFCIERCRFDDDATQNFISFLKKCIKLQCLHIGSQVRFLSHAMGDLIHSIVYNSRDNNCNLQELNIDASAAWNPNQDMIRIVHGLTNSIKSLKKFTYGYMSLDGCQTLIVCLPKMIYLKQLYITSVDGNILPLKEQILHALRQNGSLEYVQIMRGNDIAFFRQQQQILYIKNLCKRNRFLNSETFICDNAKHAALIFSHVATHVRRIAPTLILRSLQVLGRDICCDDTNSDHM